MRKDKDELRRRWSKAINVVLGEKSPCKECLVDVSCEKSFSNKTACERLATALEEALKNMKDMGALNNENKD